MSSLSQYNLEHFKNEVIDRFYPRTLILSKNDNAFKNVIKTSLKKLNKHIFQHRVYEFDVTGSVIDLTAMEISSPGIFVKRIMTIIPNSDYYSFFGSYRTIMGRSIYPFNVIKNQDNFIEFLLSNELYKQLAKRFSNRNIDYFHNDTKIILGNSYANIGKCVVFFLPGLKINAGIEEWSLYDIEEEFVCDYLEALVSFREGRAQSEMSIMDLSTNYDTLLSEGKEEMEKVVETFRKIGFARIGKRF